MPPQVNHPSRKSRARPLPPEIGALRRQFPSAARHRRPPRQHPAVRRNSRRRSPRTRRFPSPRMPGNSLVMRFTRLPVAPCWYWKTTSTGPLPAPAGSFQMQRVILPEPLAALLHADRPAQAALLFHAHHRLVIAVADLVAQLELFHDERVPPAGAGTETKGGEKDEEAFHSGDSTSGRARIQETSRRPPVFQLSRGAGRAQDCRQMSEGEPHGNQTGIRHPAVSPRPLRQRSEKPRVSRIRDRRHRRHPRGLGAALRRSRRPWRARARGLHRSGSRAPQGRPHRAARFPPRRGRRRELRQHPRDRSRRRETRRLARPQAGRPANARRSSNTSAPSRATMSSSASARPAPAKPTSPWRWRSPC